MLDISLPLILYAPYNKKSVKLYLKQSTPYLNKILNFGVNILIKLEIFRFEIVKKL